MEKNEKNEKSKKSSWVYVLSVVYVIVAYTFFFISGYINQLDLPDNLVSAKNTFAWFFLFLPIILCVANYIIMFTIGKKSRSKNIVKLCCTSKIWFNSILYFRGCLDFNVSTFFFYTSTIYDICWSIYGFCLERDRLGDFNWFSTISYCLYNEIL